MTHRHRLPIRSLVGAALIAFAWSCSIYDSNLLTSVLPDGGLAGTSGASALAGSGGASNPNATGGSVTAGGLATGGAGGSQNVAGAGGEQDGGSGGQGGDGTPISPCVTAGIVGVSLSPPQVFEAEHAELGGGARASIGGTDVSGEGYVDMIGKEGSISWIVNVAAAGEYKLTWKYAAMEDRDMELQVNCAQTHASVQFGYTGSWYANWKTDISRVVTLKAGTNRLVLATNGGSGPNFDTLTIAKN